MLLCPYIPRGNLPTYLIISGHIYFLFSMLDSLTAENVSKFIYVCASRIPGTKTEANPSGIITRSTLDGYLAGLQRQFELKISSIWTRRHNFLAENTLKLLEEKGKIHQSKCRDPRSRSYSLMAWIMEWPLVFFYTVGHGMEQKRFRSTFSIHIYRALLGISSFP